MTAYITFTLRDTLTGEERDHREEARYYDLDDPDVDFLWSEGNYSCDCNRSLFFARAAGEPESEYRSCSLTRYSLVRVTDHAGNDISDRFGAPEQGP